ncbi:uncharacterized protein DUF1540 [Psychrobacillus insolitus]|uniref:Uncharacterized protein DUF1540 n=1 Tax=Psychrobacillus insolitus TaxID=1461 RepID=A0A2W7MMJ4_9BACI|nr:DUF1540 domain-containing protein [Psychrobacillus insolitus]PZX03126.1 uncharacterized protein DUF1540 [Psychrobacillus insolitus]
MAKDVMCEVNNCTYWDSGNKCNAKAIYVVSKKGNHASTSEETDCKTFEPEA